MKNIKYFIHTHNKTQSETIQNELFSLGYVWSGRQKELPQTPRNISVKYLVINPITKEIKFTFRVAKKLLLESSRCDCIYKEIKNVSEIKRIVVPEDLFRI